MGKRHLSFPPSGSTVDKVSDVETLDSDEYASEDDEHIVAISGVQQLETIYVCMNCKKTVEPKTSTFGVCDTCNTTQKLQQ